MEKTLLLKINDLKQYDEEKKEINYKFDIDDSKKEEKLKSVTSVILSGDQKVFLGQFSKFEDHIIYIKDVDEFDCDINKLSSLKSTSINEFSTIKRFRATGLTIIDNLDIQEIKKDIQKNNICHFFIIKEAEFENLKSKFEEKDRIAFVDDKDEKIKLKIYNSNKEIDEMENYSDFEEINLTKLSEQHMKAVKTKKEKGLIQGDGINLKEVNKMKESIEKNGYYQFKNFNNFYDILINKSVLQNNKENDNKTKQTEKEKNSTNRNNIETPQPLNQILYGPPGTGKTYSTKNLVNNIIENQTISKDKSCKFITFHQSYSYEEFIEGIKPIVDGSNKDLKYEIANGIFKELCLEANKDKENKYVLVIDEINRGNISKIFGELITLIEDDKRVEPNGEDDFENTQVKDNELLVTLPYSKQKFGVPKNLYIIGTMNTSDRSIASVDIALRRRFKFIEMMPKSKFVADISIKDENKSSSFKDIFEALNEKITILLDRDHQIGHSYFIKDKFKSSNGEELNNESKIEVLKNIWFDEILPLLNEYFYNDWYKLQALLGEAELEKDKKNNEKNSSFIVKSDLSKYKMKDIDKEDKFIFNFVDRDKVNFQQALLKIIELVKNNAENKEINSDEQENN